MNTIHEVQCRRALHAPVEPAALIAFRFAPDQMFGTANAFVDTALDYRDFGGINENDIAPVIMNILPRWLRDLADRIEADGKHREHLAATPDTTTLAPDLTAS